MLTETQQTLDFRGFAPHGGFAGSEELANRVERHMHRLAVVEEEVHPGNDVDYRGGPDAGLPAQAVGRFSPADPLPELQSEARQVGIEVHLAELFDQGSHFGKSFSSPDQ